jgi:hypothetical protein
VIIASAISRDHLGVDPAIVVLIAVVTSLMAAPLVRYGVARIPRGVHAGGEAPGGAEPEGAMRGR